MKFSDWVRTVLTALTSTPVGDERIVCVPASGAPNFVTVPISGLLMVRGGAGSPEGVTSLTGPALFIQNKLTPSGHPGLWVKPDGVTGATGWVEMFAAD